MEGLEYEYGSIMHYPARLPGSPSDKDDIQTYPYNVSIGQREEMTEMDAKKLMRAYNCDLEYKPRFVGPTELPKICKCESTKY